MLINRSNCNIGGKNNNKRLEKINSEYFIKNLNDNNNLEIYLCQNDISKESFNENKDELSKVIKKQKKNIRS